MPKKKTLKYWKNKIDKPFHEYIRRRDVDNNTGYCSCISCGKKVHFTETDAGHFIGRQHLATRYDERNVHAQCRKCNRFEYGRQYEYSISLGKKLSNQLLKKSRGVLKLTDPEWQDIYDTYKTKLDQIKKQQNF